MDITTTLSEQELWRLFKRTDTSKADSAFRRLENAFDDALEGKCDDDSAGSFYGAMAEAFFLAFRAGFEAASQRR